jgi:hypothetical protein
MNKNLFLGIVAFLGLYLFSTGVSYAVFSYVVTPPTLEFLSSGEEKKEEPAEQKKESKLKALLDASGPKTEVCPMNGELFTTEEKNAWEKRRPLLVMIENHEESRPQSGLSSADIVYETVAEGGITRFMGVYYCDAQAYEVILGPVRSARTVYIDWASEYGDYPLYAHVGGANCNHGCPGGTSKADALGQLEDYGWVKFVGGVAKGNDLNQFAIGYPTFWRDYERLGRTVATEHTMYSTTERLWGVGKDRGWTNADEKGNEWDEDFVAWKFAKEAPKDGDKAQVSYDFWENSPAGDYSVSWSYDPTTKIYKRSNAGKPHMDLNKDEQLAATNIVVMYSTEANAHDNYPGDLHLVYGTTGKGDGVLFRNGQAEEITWSKKTRTSRTKFTGADGKEIEFTPGKIWISNLATGNKSLKY